MPRNMSFSLTTAAILNRTKTVTRRKGWEFLKPGDVVNACKKTMGLGKGGKVERLCQIRVTNVRREPLFKLTLNADYGPVECEKEGFPQLKPREFVEMFRREMGVAKDQILTRIEFEYVDD